VCPARGGPRACSQAFDAALPFQLTQGQADVGAVLARDLADDAPMHRLLQGEVGSGKTVVALRAMLQVVDSGGQAALLAPTEVLAPAARAARWPCCSARSRRPASSGARTRHTAGAADRLAGRCGAAHGPRRGGQRRGGIVVGTHALLSEGVSFADLGLVVVDEQHRFGVEQRDALRAKGTSPHVLVMTATPIPRTIAMTVYGDLEVATLSELPAGRAPVRTAVVPASEKPAWLDAAWQRSASTSPRAGRRSSSAPASGRRAGGQGRPTGGGRPSRCSTCTCSWCTEPLSGAARRGPARPHAAGGQGRRHAALRGGRGRRARRHDRHRGGRRRAQRSVMVVWTRSGSG
jgi:ATP-dependent DNA helicase RecG